jgi:hypothetical protein
MMRKIIFYDYAKDLYCELKENDPQNYTQPHTRTHVNVNNNFLEWHEI